MLILQFSTSLEWSSAIIRWMCHSHFSHCDIVTPDGLLGASGTGGVMIRQHEHQPFGIRRRAFIETDLEQAIIDKVLTQYGKPFDDGALYGFLFPQSRRDWRQPDKWFCSELIVWAAEQVGFFPQPLISPKNRVTPADALNLFNFFIINADTFWDPIADLPLGRRER